MYVELNHIQKRIGNYQASDDVSFGIEKGKLIGLLGPSGSGKTTDQGREPPRSGHRAKRRCGHSFPCSGRASGAGAGSSQSFRGPRQSQLEPSARRQGSPEFQPQHAGSLRSGKGR